MACHHALAEALRAFICRQHWVTLWPKPRPLTRAKIVPVSRKHQYFQATTVTVSRRNLRHSIISCAVTWSCAVTRLAPLLAGSIPPPVAFSARQAARIGF
jgi:hypothetical protein